MNQQPQYPQQGGPYGQGGSPQYQGVGGGASPVEFDAVQERARAFIWKTFGWMSLGLGLTGLVSMVVVILSFTSTEYGELVPTRIGEIVFSPMVYWGSMIVTFLMVFGLSAAQNRLSPAIAGGVFFLYAALNGIWLSAIFLVYTASSIASTFFVTAGMFGATALFGYLTKRDLSGIGSFCFMGLIGLILASIMNFFFASTLLYWGITYAGVLIFVGLTAWDVQKLRKLGGMGMDAETEAKASIQGALLLYLDFINLFLFLLRIFGNRR